MTKRTKVKYALLALVIALAAFVLASIRASLEMARRDKIASRAKPWSYKNKMLTAWARCTPMLWEDDTADTARRNDMMRETGRLWAVAEDGADRRAAMRSPGSKPWT